LNPSIQVIPKKITRLKIISSSYTKCIEEGTIPQDTEPVGTVIQKSLKVFKGQMSALHSQA
jgi:hypothetical protein